MGVDSRAACLTDGAIDDYEIERGKPCQDETALYVTGLQNLSLRWIITLPRKYRTEATTESREVVFLVSGAWNT